MFYQLPIIVAHVWCVWFPTRLNSRYIIREVKKKKKNVELLFVEYKME